MLEGNTEDEGEDIGGTAGRRGRGEGCIAAVLGGVTAVASTGGGPESWVLDRLVGERARLATGEVEVGLELLEGNTVERGGLLRAERGGLLSVVLVESEGLVRAERSGGLLEGNAEEMGEPEDTPGGRERGEGLGAAALGCVVTLTLTCDRAAKEAGEGMALAAAARAS